MGIDRISPIVPQTVETHFQRGAGGQHGIGQDQGLPFDVRAGAIIHVDVELIPPVVFAEGGNKGILGPVEDVQQSLVKRQARPHDGGQYQRGVTGGDLCDAQRRRHLFRAVFQDFADFVSKNISQTLHIRAKPETIFLDGLIAHLRHVIVKDGVRLSQVDDFHVANIRINL